MAIAILWVHVLAAAGWLGGAAVLRMALLPALAEGAPGACTAAASRGHFLTSRAMEVLVLTGVLNVVVRGIATNLTYGTPFFGLIALKTLLFVLMAALQLWMGMGWRQARPEEVATAVGRARLGLPLQLVLGAGAVLAGLEIGRY
jgi:putative copper export protein